MLRRSFLAGLISLALIAPTFASDRPVWIIGDSIGVGLALASGHKSAAVVGTRFTDTKAMLKQIAKVPDGAYVVISLGTNDHADFLNNFNKVTKITQALRAKNCSYVWVGPVYVEKGKVSTYNVNIALKNVKGGAYIGVYDYTKTLSKYRAKDGVHFTMAGYKKLWHYVEQYL